MIVPFFDRISVSNWIGYPLVLGDFSGKCGVDIQSSSICSGSALALARASASALLSEADLVISLSHELRRPRPAAVVCASPLAAGAVCHGGAGIEEAEGRRR